MDYSVEVSNLFSTFSTANMFNETAMKWLGMEVEVKMSVSTGILDTAQVSWTMSRY